MIINRIAATNTGLKVYVVTKPTERHPRDHDREVNITRHAFHGDWNYTVIPSLARS